MVVDMRWLTVVLALAVSIPIAIARATPPLGDELTFHNAGAGNAAIDPDLAYDSKRNRYLVVFSSTSGDESMHIRGRLIAADGSLVAPDFEISASGGPTETEPAITYDPDRDRYLIAWEQAANAQNSPMIVAEQLGPNGSRVDPNDTAVSAMGDNPLLATVARDPDVAYDPAAKRYLVTWWGNTDFERFEPVNEIYARALDTDAAPVGDQAAVTENADAVRGNVEPRVAYNPDDKEFLVVWHGDTGTNTVDGANEVAGQRVGPDLSKRGDRIVLSSTGPEDDTAFDAVDPDVAYNTAAEGYLVAWSANKSATANQDSDIVVQRLGRSGAAIGTDDQVLSEIGGPQPTFGAFEPTVAANPSGAEYLVAYRADHAEDDEFEIYGTRIGIDGALRGDRDVQLSDVGPSDIPSADAYDGGANNPPAAVYGSRANEFLGAWNGDDVADDEFRILGRRIGAGSVTNPPTPSPTPSPTASPDTSKPELTLKARRRQRLGSLRARVACNEQCKATLVVSIRPRGAKKTLRKRRTVTLAAGDPRTVKLRLPRKGRRRTTAAVIEGRHPLVKIRATAVDGAGNPAAPRARRVRLRKP